MKLKNAQDITKLLYNKDILDLEDYSDDENSLQPSEYLFFVKDTSYEGDLQNKLTLVIVCKHSGYVVANNFKFNSIEIKDNKITIYCIVGDRRKENYYWFKLK